MSISNKKRKGGENNEIVAMAKALFGAEVKKAGAERAAKIKLLKDPNFHKESLIMRYLSKQGVTNDKKVLGKIKKLQDVYDISSKLKKDRAATLLSLFKLWNIKS